MWNAACKLVLLSPFLFILSACACQKPNPDLVPAAGNNEILNFPPSYRMVHRVRLKVLKRSYDFIGYLAVNGASCRAVAMAEIGGTVFDMIHHSGESRVLKSPDLPVKPLKYGVLSELVNLFAHPEPSRDKTAIKIKLPVKPGGGPVLVQLVRDGCLLSEVRIQSFRNVEGWPHPVPERFEIISKNYHYRMLVELIRMDMRPVKKEIFNEK
jgi:hypothetical protein